MPILQSDYKPPLPFRNGHFATIYSSKLRPIPGLVQERERLLLEDGDFLDIDWSFSERKTHKLAILLHGLEGNAQRPYIKGQGSLLQKNFWDVAAVNYRGCSGEPNMLYQSYNAGKTDDLEEVIRYILEKDKYAEIAMIGFSLGGNLLLKYLGERIHLPKEIKTAVAISTPLCLESSLRSLEQFHNWIYRKSFLAKMRKKYKTKMEHFPEEMSVSNYVQIKSLLAFDNLYTAPAHGFKDAEDYYKKNSSLQFLPNIHIPIYILNAENDSFLSDLCYPRELASKMKNLHLEIPKFGGHVGFFKTNSVYYSEERVLKFLQSE